MIKAAVIGVGSMGANHARIYNELEGVTLVGVCDADPQLVEKVASRHRTGQYSDHRDLLDQERPDLVSIAVPTGFHHQVALDVIDRGVHLLVEKPIADTVAHAEKMVERAEARGVQLMVGHVERFNPAVVELKRKLQDGQLGKMFQIHVRRLGPFPHRVRDVGVVIDLATHDLDVMCYLTGASVLRIYAETEQEIHTHHEDSLSGLLRFDNGVVGVLDVNWLTPTKVRELYVTGEKGMFVVNYLTQDLYLYENEYVGSDWDSLGMLKGVGEGNMIKLRIAKREPLLVELESFVGCVEHGTPPPVSGGDGIRALSLAQALVSSGQEHRILEF
ncbi:MAG: Gfo/Idh/MocA family oxidoreductase [Anaerolineae bacterium]|nr:Gfo/Idh/MocA family oxidoreductase [Anaerolineae bacterium]